MNLICDTSFVGHLAQREMRPSRYGQWGEEFLNRIEGAELSVSVVTVAEARSGYLNAGWGHTRLAAAEERLRRFRWIPVRRDHIEEWSRLRVAARARGIALSDNDLWIAATASVGEQVLVTCDRDHERIAAEMPVEVVFLAPPV
jgi:predicted nucleic acid-binding protein